MAGANYKEYYQDLLEGNEMKGLIIIIMVMILKKYAWFI